jgi:uncharacterized protein YbbC (DUF1343 family)
VAALRLRVIDRARYDPVRLAVRLLAAVRLAHPDSLRIDTLRLDQRSGQPAVRRGVERGAHPDSIAAGWEAGLARFVAARSRYLLY